MKVEFEIECTPEEARKFLGLPDVIPMQDALMKQLQAKLSENIRNLDPEALAKTWVPVTMQNWSEMQKMFWSQIQNGGMKTWSSAQKPEPEAAKTTAPKAAAKKRKS